MGSRWRGRGHDNRGRGRGPNTPQPSWSSPTATLGGAIHPPPPAHSILQPVHALPLPPHPARGPPPRGRGRGRLATLPSWLTEGGDSPLIRASREGQLDVVRSLLAGGAGGAGAAGRGGQSLGSNVNNQDHAGHTALLWAALMDKPTICALLISNGADLYVTSNAPFSRTVMRDYGIWADEQIPQATKAARCSALEAAFREGPHPQQVQRRRNEHWERRAPLQIVLAENNFRPLLHRLLAAAAVVDPATPVEPVVIDTKDQRHAHLLSQVFTNEGIVRLIVRLL